MFLKVYSFIFIICLGIVLNYQIQAQTWQPQNYNGIAQSNKTPTLMENFDNNRNQWLLKSSEIKLEGGHLVLASDNEKLASTATLNINENENFEIQAGIKYFSGSEKRAFGLQWGRSEDGKRFFSFVINASGQYAISKFSGAYINFKRGQTNAIKKTGTNKLTIRKVDNMSYFFINDELVHSQEYKLAYGNNTGFQSAGGNTVKIDYINIYKLKYVKENLPPEIIITSPSLDKTFAELKENDKSFLISGRVKDEESIRTIKINEKSYSVEANGTFSVEIELSNNKNIKLSATDNQLQSTQEYINLKRSIQNTNINTNTETSSLKTNIEGAYHALIIGVNDYKFDGIIDLEGPIKDAEKLKNVLTKNYTFEEENIKFLKNPTREELIIAFDDLGHEIGPEDNLLIFYAGHGYWDSDKRQGFWIPSDANWESTANWFRNTTLKSYIATINTKNILLITDACFSGSIFKTRSFSNVPVGLADIYNLPSRKAMTSGNLKEVPDDSQFLKFLCQRLIYNKEPFITAEKLFGSFREAVINNTENEPQFGTIKNSGDQGGDFIFIRRQQ